MPIDKEIRRLLKLARDADASDIHIVADLPPTFRVQGEIVMADTPPLSREDTARLSLGLLNEEQRKAFERDWQISCSVYDPELGRFRVSVYYQGANPEMAIRPVGLEIKSREELHLPEIAEDLIRHPSGLVLVTGPTGSGKTTTMNFMVDLINSEHRCKIITLEDPVEYVHTRKKAIIIQQELYTDVKSFSAGLVHVLRQDPDVICIGEMRDYETTATALTAAETGHLVIATCHTPNTLQTVERIVSVFPPHQETQAVTQFANSVRGVIAQRLIPSADKKRRLLATEILTANTAVRHCIREREYHKLVHVIQTGRRDGMHMMDDSLVEMYDAGDITYDMAITNATFPIEMRSMIHRNKEA